jgi:hypothetical protein
MIMEYKLVANALASAKKLEKTNLTLGTLDDAKESLMEL